MEDQAADDQIAPRPAKRGRPKKRKLDEISGEAPLTRPAFTKRKQLPLPDLSSYFAREVDAKMKSRNVQ